MRWTFIRGISKYIIENYKTSLIYSQDDIDKSGLITSVQKKEFYNLQNDILFSYIQENYNSYVQYIKSLCGATQVKWSGDTAFLILGSHYREVPKNNYYIEQYLKSFNLESQYEEYYQINKQKIMKDNNIDDWINTLIINIGYNYLSANNYENLLIYREPDYYGILISKNDVDFNNISIY